jgi:Flp pilus assembly secretin CpaC
VSEQPATEAQPGLTVQELRGNVLRLSRGSSGAICTESPHDRLVVNDPALISVAPMTPTRFVVTAKAKGTTTVTVWEHKTGRSQKYEILVDDQ